MLILTIIGTRPEAIKLAPVLKILKAREEQAQIYICVSAQHRDMLDQMLSFFDITPDSDLDLMKPAQSLSETMASVVASLDALLLQLKPDWVLVQGDTTSALASALAAFHQGIKVAHVEAGLRSHDLRNPFPEEMNRVVIDRLSSIHFAPTITSKLNLLSEGITESSILITGNTSIDALESVQDSPKMINALVPKIPCNKRMILVTAHRRENHGEPLRMICDALMRLSQRNDVQIIFPVHRNPHVWQAVHDNLASAENILLLPPVEYPTLLRLMKDSFLILTDSGGIQEEASALGKPVLVLRSVTDRPEALDAGIAKVIGTNTQDIVGETQTLLDDGELYRKMAIPKRLFGDGMASERIAEILLAGGVRSDHFDEWTGA